MHPRENNIIEMDYVPLEECDLGGVGYSCFYFMKKHGDKIAQINISTDEKETYNILLQKCIRTSIVFKTMGIRRGDVITFCSKINLNSYVPIIACFLIGAIPSYLDGTFPLLDIIHFVKSINPKLFLVTPDLFDSIQDLLRKENRVVDVVVFDDNFFKPSKEESEFSPIYVDDLQETAIIHFSSGSTGFPKGICINHSRFMSHTALSMGSPCAESDQKVALTYDSLHWSVESFHLVYSIREGVCRLISSDEDDYKETWYILAKYRVNVAYLIPWLLMKMLESGKPEGLDLTSLTTIYVAGSLLRNKYQVGLQKLLPNVDIFHNYGLTETGSLIKFSKIDLHREYSRTKPETIGTPIINSGISLKVVDLKTGKPLEPNRRGELRAKSKYVMNGYYNLDSSDQFDEDGWFKTGDIVYYDEDLCFFIVGRIKDLILFQGYHIVPAILETELLSHHAVKLAVVIGVPDDKDTEHPMGLVVLHKSFDSVSPSEIEKYVEERVPDRYKLRGGVKIIEESYLKTGNKIKRYTLKKLVLSGKI